MGMRALSRAHPMPILILPVVSKHLNQPAPRGRVTRAAAGPGLGAGDRTRDALLMRHAHGTGTGQVYGQEWGLGDVKTRRRSGLV